VIDGTTRMTDHEAVSLLWGACNGMGGLWYPTMAAIGMAESLLDIHAMNLNDHDPDSRSYLSVDWGWLQINDFWNGLTIEQCREMFDPRLCAKKAQEIFMSVKPYGEGYKRWNTYVTGRHLAFRPRMIVVARELGIPGV
jgi:hypothetical protein